MSEACFVCGRKANRQCPAGSTLEPDPGVVDESIQVLRPICSGCCGKGRRRTIDCPDSCTHMHAAAMSALLKLVDLSQDPDFELRHSEVLHNLRVGVSHIRRNRVPDLRDSEARQAFANVADTLRTRSSGLIYNFRSPDPRVQTLSDELVTVVTLHLRGGKGMVKVDAATLMQCLKYLERQAAAAEKEERGASYFLDLVVQSVASVFVTREPDGLVGKLTEDEEGNAVLDLGRFEATKTGEERTQSGFPASE
ncbi:MAG: hypothetical protein NTX53_16675 [candidate division WOR-3 bacterium]|nr:hypothetical protein [candidate division WOR-3 bacterium]